MPPIDEGLLDLLEDDRLRQQVALGAVARPAVERAEVAVRVADVRVVDVPVDDERHASAVDLAVAELVGGPADRDEVAALEERHRLGVFDPLAGERLVEDRGDAVRAAVPAHASTASETRKRSSGTFSRAPTSAASSKKVSRARALAGAEAVAELLEVAGEEAGRVAVALARLAGQPLGLGARPAMCVEERRLELGDSFGRRVGAGKDRIDHRQPGALEPQAPEVVVRRRVLEHALQRGVADEELGIGVVGLLERHLLGIGEEDAHQHGRGRALRRDRDGVDAVDRRTRDELDRVDGSFGGDAETRKDPERCRRAGRRRSRRSARGRSRRRSAAR